MAYLKKNHKTYVYQRDRERCMALEKKGAKVFTLNRDIPPEQCVPGRHTQTTLGRRSLALLPKNIIFDEIHVEYLRMPVAYVEPIVFALLNVLPSMAQYSPTRTQIYLPNVNYSTGLSQRLNFELVKSTRLSDVHPLDCPEKKPASFIHLI